MHVSEAEVAAIVTVGELLVIKPELMQNGGVKVVHVHFTLHGMMTVLIGVAVGDAGIKAVGMLRAMPEVDGRPGVTVDSMDPDRTVYKLDAGVELQTGDQLALLPPQQDAMVSRWDRFIGLRGGKVEVVWDIQARGCHN